VDGNEPCPLLGLRVLHEGEDLRTVEGHGEVVVRLRALEVAMGEEVRLDGLLEGLLEVDGYHRDTSSLISILPVTAAEMRAERCSCRAVM